MRLPQLLTLAAVLFLGLLFGASAFADDGRGVVGRWKTVDDHNHQTESVVRIWESGGKLYGAIHCLYGFSDEKIRDCCSGEKKNAKMKGMTFLWGLQYDGKAWDGGQIMDPKDGKVYRCKIQLDGDGSLKVRGYVGVAAFGRTQRWFRAE